jgi:hypothetical protein
MKEQLNRMEKTLNEIAEGKALRELADQLRKPTESLESAVKANQPPT